ncbi:MAG TPA: ComEA family DNA-binding protein [Solirubrobacteraceae bacterium]|nr:ComEA family DNA-binding protein [Solirubrobacteraceae bacterium]
MRDIPRPQLLVYAAAAIAIALIGARYVQSEASGSGGSGASSSAARSGSGSGSVQVRSAGDALVVVQVAGEVQRPGVYRLRGSDRVQDAVKLAGGPTRHANLQGLNLAAKLEDGRQIVVPRRTGSSASTSPQSASGSDPSTAGAVPSRPVNLNTATAEQLDSLDGVGPVMAQKIIAYRQQHGGFGSVNELDRIPGIGEKRMATLRDQVTV